MGLTYAGRNLDSPSGAGRESGGGASPYRIRFGVNPSTPRTAPGLGKGWKEGRQKSDRCPAKYAKLSRSEAGDKKPQTRTSKRGNSTCRTWGKSHSWRRGAGKKRRQHSAWRRLHPKLALAYNHLTGPREGMSVIPPGLRFTVRLRGRQTRQRSAAASGVTPFYHLPPKLRHDLEDEYSHLVWSADLGLADTSAVAVTLYTSTNDGWFEASEEPQLLWRGSTRADTEMALCLLGSRRTM